MYIFKFNRSPSPFSIFKKDEGLEKKDSFFMLEPSEESNGCFLAVLNREVSSSKQLWVKNDDIWSQHLVWSVYQ